MKKIFRNSRLIAIAFFTVFTASAAHAVPANNGIDLPVELKFVGSMNNQTIFQLKISGNTLHDDFILIIRDEFGNSIYKENIKAENFSKKFLFDTEELGDDTLLFEVFCRKTNKSVQYKISRQYHHTEEVLVSELK
jgi:hypothetical protein